MLMKGHLVNKIPLYINSLKQLMIPLYIVQIYLKQAANVMDKDSESLHLHYFYLKIFVILNDSLESL